MWIDDELWADAAKASAEYQIKTGIPTTVSQWIRDTLRAALTPESLEQAENLLQEFTEG